jgi:hypothetical protein
LVLASGLQVQRLPSGSEGIVIKKKRATGAHAVGDNVVVRLHNGRIVEAVIKARIEKTDGVRLQVSFGQETALIHEFQVLDN